MNKRKDLNKKMGKHSFKSFGKKERSSFLYWFYHWKAFNLVAFYLNIWKIKYLFHDIEKPWLRLFLSYEKVQHFHRKYNSHHREYYKGFGNIDIEGMVIDNECSRFTKELAKLNAREFIEKYPANTEFNKNYYNKLDELGL